MATEFKLPYTGSQISEKLGKIDSLALKSEIPTKVSQLNNDSGYLTSVPVTSVNNNTGAVNLTASDVGALPDSTQYAASSSVGGAADYADRLNTNAGSTIQPVYFKDGKPVETTYTLGASVPSDAKFTDTVYTHPNSGVVAGTYKSVTVDANGHITGGSNPTTLEGYGIRDAETKTDAENKLHEAKEYTDNFAQGFAGVIQLMYGDDYSDENPVTIRSIASDEVSDAISNIEIPSIEGLATENYVNTQIAAIPTPDVSGQINTHNVATDAHNDIRLLVEGLTTRLNTLADSDDTTLDQMSEIVSYIKSNKDLIDGITTNKVNVSDIINNITTNVDDKPLSAAQGVVLKDLIDELEESLTNYQQKGDYALTSQIPTKVSQLANDSNYLTSIPAEYITETELNAKGYLTQHQDLSSYAKTSQIPTQVSQLVNDSNYLTSIPSEYVTETELTNNGYLKNSDVSAWAKEAKKPTYTAAEVGALPDTTVIPTVPTKVSAFENDKGYLTQHQSLDAYAKTADLGALATKDNLTASDVGAIPDTTKIPSKLSDLTADSTHRTVTDTEKNAWNAKANVSDIPTKVGDLTNDKGYITGYTETDPTVPSWAKAATKPSYTASEVGALPSTTKIPSKVSELTNDSKYATESYVDTKVASHNTAADAHLDIRTSISQLSSEITEFVGSGKKEVTYVPNLDGYIDAQTGKITTNNLDGQVFHTDYIELDGYNLIYAQHKLSSIGIAIAFFDASKTLLTDISIIGAGASGFNVVEMDVPSEAAYCILSCYEYSGNPKSYIKLIPINGLTQRMDKLEESMENFVSTSPLNGKTIAVLGDSISSVAYTVPNYWQLIAEKTGCNFLDYGVSGACFAVRSGSTTSFVERASSMGSADAVLVMGGTNDANKDILLGDWASTDNTTLYGALNALIATLRSKYPGRPIIFCTPIKMKGDKDDGFPKTMTDLKNATASTNLELWHCALAIKAKCAVHGIPVIDLYNESGIGSGVSSYFRPDDTLHPSDLGECRIANMVQPVLEQQFLHTADLPAELINLVQVSIDTDGSIYNGTGYKDGYRLNSSGTNSTADGGTVTGFIPCTSKDVIRMKYAEWIGWNAAGTWVNSYVCFYDANFTHLESLNNSGTKNGKVTTSPSTIVADSNGVTTFDLDYASGFEFAYIRISAKGNGAGMFVTKNQEITV